MGKHLGAGIVAFALFGGLAAPAHAAGWEDAKPLPDWVKRLPGWAEPKPPEVPRARPPEAVPTPRVPARTGARPTSEPARPAPPPAKSVALERAFLDPRPFVTAGKTTDKMIHVVDARIVYAYRVCIDAEAGPALVIACQTREPQNRGPACQSRLKAHLAPGECRDIAGWRITIEPEALGATTRGYYRYLGL